MNASAHVLPNFFAEICHGGRMRFINAVAKFAHHWLWERVVGDDRDEWRCAGEGVSSSFSTT